jgi:glycosyltransferase involved in cell wall biosynthesis
VVDNLSFRGGERTFLQLVEGLDRSRYDIRVACSPGGIFVERLEALGVPVIPCNMRKKWRPDIAPRLIRDLRRFRPHIVHTQGRGDPYGRIAGQAAGADLILSSTAAVAGRYRVKARARKAMYKAIDLVTDAMVDHYIVVNRESVEWLGRQHGVPPSRVSVIYNGIELERYRPDPATRGLLRRELGIPDDAFLVGGLGAFNWEKGFRYLVGAMVEVVERGGWLVIGGDGDDRKAMVKQAAELGVQDYCLFPGFIHDVPAFLGDLDLFALSSIIEGHPMVLLEAMAMKCPIVSTDIAGARESIEDGTSGILVEPKDAGALAEGILRVMEAEDRGRGMGEAARDTVEERFTVERVVAETDALYRKLLASV